MRITIIVAMAADGLIGSGGELPWRLPADLKHFKAMTMGKPILMGRKTYQSIGKALPGRQNVVLTRDTDFEADGCTVTHSLEEALNTVASAGELMVIGGADVYRFVLPHADRIVLTRIDGAFEGDTFFPDIDWDDWREVARERHGADDRNAHAFTFLTLERRT